MCAPRAVPDRSTLLCNYSERNQPPRTVFLTEPKSETMHAVDVHVCLPLQMQVLASQPIHLTPIVPGAEQRRCLAIMHERRCECMKAIIANFVLQHVQENQVRNLTKRFNIDKRRLQVPPDCLQARTTQAIIWADAGWRIWRRRGCQSADQGQDATADGKSALHQCTADERGALTDFQQTRSWLPTPLI
jgi:hypothetical protein